jgi:hypothetical protein
MVETKVEMPHACAQDMQRPWFSASPFSPRTFTNFSAASIPRMHAAEGQFYPQEQGNTLMFIHKQFILHFCWLSGRKTVSSTKHGCMHTHGANLTHIPTQRYIAPGQTQPQ